MTIIIENQTLENSFQELANSLKIDIKTLLEKAMQDFIISQELKRVDEIANNVRNGYLEVIEARKNGKSFQTLDEFLDEL